MLAEKTGWLKNVHNILNLLIYFLSKIKIHIKGKETPTIEWKRVSKRLGETLLGDPL